MNIPNEFFMDEVRNGFYVSSLMKKNWAASMQILEELDNICREHDLRWFAAYGTMLGAVRHKGFVPWDDDIDIFMFREDYDKLKKLTEDGTVTGYMMKSMDSEEAKDSCFACFFPNMRIPMCEEKLSDRLHGYPFVPLIDIFPLDYIHPNKKKEDEIANIAHGTRVVAAFVSEETGELITETKEAKKDLEDMLSMLSEITGKRFLRNKTLKQQMLKATEELISTTVSVKDRAERVCVREFQLKYRNNNYDIKSFESYIEMGFECMKMRVPIGYEALLRHMFGDYHKLIRGEGHLYPVFQKQIAELHKNNMSVLEYTYVKEESRSSDIALNSWQRIGKMRSLNPAVTDTMISCIANEAEGDALQLMTDYQDMIINVGNILESLGEVDCVHGFESLCEKIYNLSELIANEEDKDTLLNEASMLKEFSEKVFENIPERISKKRRIVFLPFSSANWNAMDSVWKAAKSNDFWQVDVVPIPYYYRTIKGDLYDIQYDIEGYPEEIHPVRYDEYDFEGLHPDMIITQYPYDEYNFSFSVHPFFYSNSLRKYTEKLVYIPWFITDDFKKEEKLMNQTMEYYCAVPGVVNSDYTIVQSETVRERYIERLQKLAGEDTKNVWEKKIRGTGSTKDLKNINIWLQELEQLLYDV